MVMRILKYVDVVLVCVVVRVVRRLNFVRGPASRLVGVGHTRVGVAIGAARAQ